MIPTGYILGVRTRAFRLIAAALVVPLLLSAHQASGQVRWQTGVADTPKMQPQVIQQAINDLAAGRDSRHLVVKFDQPMDPALRWRLKGCGLRLLSYLGDNAFFASVCGQRLDAAALAEVRSLRSVQAVQRQWKLHPMLLAGETAEWSIVDNKDEQNPIVAAYVLFHPDVALNPVGLEVAVGHGSAIRSELHTVNGLVIELPRANIDALADEDAVQWIEPPLPAMSVVNNSNRVRVGADIVHQPPYGLDGSGVTVLVYDGGTVRATHVDFGGRAHVRDSSGMSYHATHVAGTVGGSGQASGGNYKGMAPAVTIQSYGFEQEGGLQEGFLYTDPGDIEQDYDEAINTYGADISNNSIGTNTAYNGFPCEWEGNYGVTANLIDSIVRGALGEPFRIVWANGNERSSGRCGTTYHTTAPPACGKNHITVGALNSNDDSVTSFTSWGPADDGRLKPDVSGPGCQSNADYGVTSCDDASDTAYYTLCGTSMSCPTVCGLGALLIQDYRNHYPGEPDFLNSTLKVLLAHTAEDIENPGPDYKSGYGSVRIQPAVDLLREGNFLQAEVDQGETFSVMVAVDPGQTPLKVTLAWDDVPGTPNVDPVLVNDLDLRVFDSAQTEYYPWTLDPDNPSANAVQTQPDRVNNIEQVQVDNPAPGAYRIEVHGYNVPDGPQTFSLAATPLLVACSLRGTISLDQDRYRCDATVTIQVVDCDLNTDDQLVETVEVTIDSDSEPAGETVTLVETSAETAAFWGSIELSATDDAGVLLVAHGDTVTATYIDADDGQGGTNVTVTDTAFTDCAPPYVSNVQVIDAQPRTATITFNTDEPALGTIRYGWSCDSLSRSEAGAEYDTLHTFDLTELTDNVTYYFVVDAEDEAGNLATDDNGGACYTFTTPDVPDYFTEQFDSENDLDDLSILFTPNGSVDFYEACVKTITELPTDPLGGTELSVGDDGYETVSLADGQTVPLYGASYSSLYVCANGYLTFDSGDTDRSESLWDHFERPRVSALFDDLNPVIGGTVSYKQLDDRLAVTWQNVPEYYSVGSNTFQAEMFFDGRVRLSYHGIDAQDGLVGLSEGNGVPADLYQTNFTSLAPCPVLPCPGDLDGDGYRNTTDFTIFAGCYGSQLGDPNYLPDADMDSDGFINATDFTIFAGYYLVPCP